MKVISKITLIGVIFLNLTTSCEQDIESEINQDNLNKFKMIVNGKVWTPSVIDSCNRTFKCQMATFNRDNFYMIEAYRDPLLTANLMSENFFEIKIIKGNGTGTYLIDGVFRDLSNYARLTINDLNGKRRYQNKEYNSSFKLRINQLFPIPNTSEVGIGGSFDGPLFNIDNPSDSIIITGGEFTFRKLNFNNFNQCKE